MSSIPLFEKVAQQCSKLTTEEIQDLINYLKEVQKIRRKNGTNK